MGLVITFPAEHVEDDACAVLIAHIDGFIEAAELLKHRLPKSKTREIGYFAGILRIICDEKMEKALDEARVLHDIERAHSKIEIAPEEFASDEGPSDSVCWPLDTDFFDFLQDS